MMFARFLDCGSWAVNPNPVLPICELGGWIKRDVNGLCKLKVKLKSEGRLLRGVGLMPQKGKTAPATGRPRRLQQEGGGWASPSFLLVGSSPDTPPWLEGEDWAPLKGTPAILFWSDTKWHSLLCTCILPSQVILPLVSPYYCFLASCGQFNS